MSREQVRSLEEGWCWKKASSEDESVLDPDHTRAFKEFRYLGPRPEMLICQVWGGAWSAFLLAPRVILTLTCRWGQGRGTTGVDGSD